MKSQARQSRPENMPARDDTPYGGLAHSRAVGAVLGAFQKATGLAIHLVPIEPGGESRSGTAFNPLCHWLSRQPASRAACRQFVNRLRQRFQTWPRTCLRQCFAGMTELAVPVLLGDTPLAVLLCGQVFRKPPSERGFEHLLQRIPGRGGVDFDQAQARELYFRTSAVPVGRMRAAARLLEILAKHLADAAHQRLLADQQDDPVAIARAKKFVQEHLTDNIRTHQAAEQAHLSLQHFCREFRAATGLTFTEYTARLRVEKAKQLLADRRLRISDVAYESGFQSIPHFDRVFKRCTGNTPTEHRASLHSL
jgi:AraC-like DNA-binding protein